MSVKRCMREIDAEEFTWWMAYDRRHPLDDRGANWRAARLCQTMAGQYRRASLADFLPPWAQPVAARIRRTWRDWQATLKALAGR